MPRNFLIGNFLPAYGTSFGRIEPKKSTLKPLSRDELEMRFERRNQQRKQERTRYIMVLQVGMVAALTASIAAFNVRMEKGEAASYAVAEQEVVQMEEIVQTEQLQKPPPPPRPPVPVEVPDDVILDDDEMDFDALLDLDEAITDIPPPPAPVIEEETEPEIFMIVENPPEMVGGFRALAASLKYPEIARRAGISGTVVVQIVVGEDGSARDAIIYKSVQESLDNEALRAVLAQSYIPGRQRGRPVPVYMRIPVIFRLN